MINSKLITSKTVIKFKLQQAQPHGSLASRRARCSRTLAIAAGAVTLWSAVAAQATILTFDVNSSGYAQTLPAGYGDNISQASVGGYTYLEGNGWTPDIVVDFTPDPLYGLYTIYETGYADTGSGVTLLPNALGHQSFDVPGEVILTPSNGEQVFLYDFDIGTWLTSGYQTDIRIWDDSGSRDNPNLFNFNQLLGPGVVYSPLTSTISGSGPLHIFINNLGSTGLDNLSFSQAPVPVPAAAWLLGSGLIGLLGMSRKCRR